MHCSWAYVPVGRVAFKVLQRTRYPSRLIPLLETLEEKDYICTTIVNFSQLSITSIAFSRQFFYARSLLSQEKELIICSSGFAFGDYFELCTTPIALLVRRYSVGMYSTTYSELCKSIYRQDLNLTLGSRGR